MGKSKFILLFYNVLLFAGTICFAKISEDELKSFLQSTYEHKATELCYISNIAEFDHETDINNKTKEEKALNTTLQSANIDKEIWQTYFRGLTPDDVKDPGVKRQVKFLSIIGSAILDSKELEKLTNVTTQMTDIYSTAKICPYQHQNCNISKEGLNLEPEIEALMANSTDYDELLYVWKSWRDATGAKMKDLYKTYVNLSNEVARANNFSDNGDFWRFSYEDPNFVQNIDDIWTKIEPLYLELHKYVARKLQTRYGDKLNISDGLVPAHVFGNMWAQSWNNLADLVKPFPNASKMNADRALKDGGYNVLDLFKIADDFYQSLGLVPMGMCYNETAGAMIRKPTDGREVLCHASAWDFCDGKTFRLKMCTKLNFEDFITIHHEMGHIQYYIQYKNQPYTFRDGANPGFHEAIGDTIALSVATPKHLAKINLLKNYTDTKEASLNALMDMALDKIAFLPYGLLIDKWRWDVFNNSVSSDKWNSHYWQYRMKYQRIKAPIARSDETDFDPGAKFHVAGDSQYIAYFVAHILQFQFYKSLCIAAGQYNPQNTTTPLHSCDFYQSKKAGDLLSAGLSLGSSKHWSQVLEIMTGEKTVDASAVLEYFQPLYEFLKEANGSEEHASAREVGSNENASNEDNSSDNSSEGTERSSDDSTNSTSQGSSGEYVSDDNSTESAI